MKITISASIRYREHIKSTLQQLQKIGIQASFPNLTTNLKETEITLDIKRQHAEDHYRSITQSDALYVSRL